MTLRSLRALATLVVAALLPVFAPPAYANDIHELGSPGGNWDYIKDAGQSTEHSLGQGFRIEAYQAVNVHHVGVYLQRVGAPENACVVVSLRDSAAGWDLATKCVPAADVTTAGGWVDFYFTPTLAITPGNDYFLYVRYYGSCDSCMRLHWAAGSYRGGWPYSRYGQDGTGCCWMDSDTDLKFLVAVDHSPTARTDTAAALSSTSESVTGTVLDDSDNDAQGFVEYGIGSLDESTPMQPCAEGATCSFTLSGLAPGTLYDWRFCAQNAIGTQCGDLKTFRTSGVNNPPNAPASPNPAHGATGVPTSVDLTFTGGDPDGHAPTYTVYLDAGTTATTVRCASAPTPKCPNAALGGLASGTTYTWFVIATDPGGIARTGPKWTFTTATYPGPSPYRASAPTPADFATGVPTTTNLSWTGGDPEGEAVSYAVYFREKVTGGSLPMRCGWSPATTCPNGSLGGLTPGKTYEWRVDTSDGKTTTTGTTWTFTVAAAPNTPPNAPTGPTPAHGATGRPTSTTVAWSASDPDGDFLTYTVYLDAGWSATTPRCTGAAATCTASGLGGLEPDTTYAWRVVARDAHGAETEGPTWSFTTGPVNNPPNPPSSPTPAHGATNVASTTSLSWTASDPDGHALTYNVFFDEGTVATTPRCSGPTPTCASSKLPTLFAGRTYAWRVNVSDGHGGLTTGPTWTFTTRPANRAPNAPSFPTPALGATNVKRGTSLSWTGGDPDGDPVRYDVWLDAGGSATTLRCEKVPTPTCPNSAFGQLAKGFEYTWRVWAYDGKGGVSNASFTFYTTSANTAPDPASAPVPANGTTAATPPLSLSWTGWDPDADSLTYDVYLDEGTTATTKRCSAMPGPTCPSTTVGALKQGTDYAWKVVAKDPDGLTSTSPTWTFTTTWTEHWRDHRQVLQQVYRDPWVAVFHDPSVSTGDAAWVPAFASRVVAYAHKAYGSMVSYPVQVVLHQGRHDGGHAGYYSSPEHDFRNVIDIGVASWVDGPGNRDVVIHEIAHVVESTSHGKHMSPAYDKVWRDGPWPELVVYDTYQALARTEPLYLADVRRTYDTFVLEADTDPVEGTKGSYHWFRDFFHPLWRLRGAPGMKRYHELVGAHWRLKGASLVELDAMNMGEFVHFMSGAMRRDLRGLVTRAFGWPEEPLPSPRNWTRQLDNARTAFPAVTYPRCDVTADAVLRVYRDPTYGGGCLAFDDDARDLSYEFLGDALTANDAISSVRVKPGWKAVLYDGPNFTGTSQEVTGELPQFVAVLGALENKTTSIKLIRTI